MSGVFVLKELRASVNFRRHAVVGIYGEKRPFVQHAALLEKDCEVKSESQLPLNHMGPPLLENNLTLCHLLAEIKLSNEDIEALDDWLAEVSTQYRNVSILRLQQYIIHPHMQWVVSEEGIPIRQRFSCVGYVVEAYRAAGIELIDEQNVPFAAREVLSRAYPLFEQISQNPRLSERWGFQGFEDLGVPGDGPWRIVLPGYIFHSVQDLLKVESRPIGFTPERLEMAEFPLPG